MKILNLKFKNINSLSGENEIDFTDPVFTNDGLFAITGKTGSGKSSILDAISIALYGKTPRVDITGSENAIMTRGEKDCYAEIIFEVGGKKYKSSWKQERTRTGNLKPVKRLISDANNKIIADQVRTCDKKIVDIMGLTFEQFTKVVMLAQGSFTAFLQADKNDKGKLLEQITGTEIYGEISKNVYDRNKIEQEKLNKIITELEAIQILSNEEIKILKEEIAISEKEKEKIDKELQNLGRANKWLDDIGRLQKQINEAKQKLPELEVKTKIAKENFEKYKAQLEKLKEEKKTQEPVFKKVRELDTKITEKEKLLQPIHQKITELEKRKKELSDILEKQHLDLEKSKKIQLEKQNWATENKKYGELVSNYSAIEKENQLLIESYKKIEKQKDEISKLEKESYTAKTNVKNTTESFNKIKQKLDDETKKLETQKAELEKILGGKELSQIQSEKENITSFITQLKSLIDIENEIEANKKEIEQIKIKLNLFEKENTKLLKSLENDKTQIDSLENQIQILNENISLTKTIQSLEEHRNNLKDGEPCPLCGALEHPYAVGNVPQPGEKEKQLAKLKQLFQDISKTVQQNEKKLTVLTSDQKNNLENKAKEEKALKENIKKQQEILSEIKSINPEFSIPDKENKVELLKDIWSEKQAKFNRINSLIRQAINIEKQIKNIRDKQIPQLQNDKEKAQKAKNEAVTSQKLINQQLEEKQKSYNENQSKYNTDYTTFLNKLKKYKAENINELKKHLEEWNDNDMQIEELTEHISILDKNISLNKKELENNTKQHSDKQKEKQDIESEKAKLAAERQKLFADKSVEAEESRLNEMIEEIEAAKNKADKEKNVTITELEKIKAIVKEKEKALSTEQAKEITKKTIEELQTDINFIKEKTEELSEEIGAKNQRLKTNAENLKASESKLKEKEKQQEICNKWGKLNELIGSSDGKKYRNFAQALTFEHLIGLSNKQLQKMSERYILKRTGDNTNPFELSVIDKYQNSEERTVQNLSGGEKFIVSLSLALGLANMASKNMRIDTMFIDEGFGTLDTDYLDVALNALSNLQSEGKIIGVISHLTELKERIATHIEITPSGTGHSKIQIIN